jgi:hypothetical protein
MMNQPLPGLTKRTVFSLLMLLSLSGCRLVSIINQASTTATPTPFNAQTPMTENCFFTWAHGGGSKEFDKLVTQKLAGEGVTATVENSSYGEIYSCTNTFGAMSLDVQVEVNVDTLADQDFLAVTADKVISILQDNLTVSKVPNMGNVNVSFSTSDGNKCFWDKALKKCAE